MQPPPPLEMPPQETQRQTPRHAHVQIDDPMPRLLSPRPRFRFQNYIRARGAIISLAPQELADLRHDGLQGRAQGILLQVIDAGAEPGVFGAEILAAGPQVDGGGAEGDEEGDGVAGCARGGDEGLGD